MMPLSPACPFTVCSHFSLSNGDGRHQGNLPRLLRRLATEIAKLGPDVMILDLVVRDEVDDNGSNFTATVYYGHSVGWSGSNVSKPASAGRAAT